ncbi:MAG: lytic transglycosylase domain-containing protein [Desulfuromonadales bacterium]
MHSRRGGREQRLLFRGGRPDRLDDPCTNVKVGARILADCLNRYGYTWEGIGCYNAVNLEKRAVYARKIIKVIDRMRESAPRKSAR